MIYDLKESPSAHHPVQVNSISNQRSTRFLLVFQYQSIQSIVNAIIDAISNNKEIWNNHINSHAHINSIYQFQKIRKSYENRAA